MRDITEPKSQARPLIWLLSSTTPFTQLVRLHEIFGTVSSLAYVREKHEAENYLEVRTR